MPTIRCPRRIIGEWLFAIAGPAKGRPGRITVAVANAEVPDLAFAKAVAILIEVWMNAAPRARR